jgi:hypothetical protein
MPPKHIPPGFGKYFCLKKSYHHVIRLTFTMSGDTSIKGCHYVSLWWQGVKRHQYFKENLLKQGVVVRNELPTETVTMWLDAKSVYLTRWHDDKMTRWQDYKVTRWQGYKVTRWQGGKVTRWQGGKHSRWQSDMEIRWQGENVRRWQGDYWLGDKVTRWQVYKVIKVTGWQGDKDTRWQGEKVTI